MNTLSLNVLRNFKMCVNFIKDQVTLNEHPVKVTGIMFVQRTLVERSEKVPCLGVCPQVFL